MMNSGSRRKPSRSYIHAARQVRKIWIAWEAAITDGLDADKSRASLRTPTEGVSEEVEGCQLVANHTLTT